MYTDPGRYKTLLEMVVMQMTLILMMTTDDESSGLDLLVLMERLDVSLSFRVLCCC